MTRIVAIIAPSSRISRAVISALKSDSDWEVRPVSRTSKYAANLDDVTALTTAFRGVEAVFLHLPVNLQLNDAKEHALSQGKNVALACRAAHVPHLIFSTAVSPLPMLGISARHLDARAELDIWLRHSAPWLQLSCIMVPITFQELIESGGLLTPQHVDGSLYRFAIPVGNKPLDLIDAEDAGRVVQQILAQPKRFQDKTVALSSGKLTVKEISGIFNNNFQPAQFHDSAMALEEMRSLPLPGMADMANMFEFIDRVDQQYSIRTTFQLLPRAATLDQWVALNRQTIGASLASLSTVYW